MIFIFYCTHLWSECSLDVSNFPDEISSLFPFVVFFYFLALLIEEGLLISSSYFLEL